MELPNVSVVMAVRNESAWINESLGALLAQDYPADAMEILLVDGASEDRTLAIVAALPGTERVIILHNPQRLQAVGLNIATEHARGEIVVRVDGHTIVAPDYVRQCVSALKLTGAQGVGGLMRPVGITPTGKVIAAATQSAFAVPTAFHVGQTARYTDTVYMGAWPRSLLERLGGFDEELATNEDYELHYRIRQLGGKLYLSPDITSEYICRQSLDGLIRQYYAYGKGKVRTLRKHPRSLRLRQLAAPGLVASLLLGLVLGALSTVVFLLWLAMVTTYMALCLAFSVRVGRLVKYENRGPIWGLPLVFFAIHMSWGLGFWRGLVTRPRSPKSVSAATMPDPFVIPEVHEVGQVQNLNQIATLEGVSPRTARR